MNGLASMRRHPDAPMPMSPIESPTLPAEPADARRGITTSKPCSRDVQTLINPVSNIGFSAPCLDRTTNKVIPPDN